MKVFAIKNRIPNAVSGSLRSSISSQFNNFDIENCEHYIQMKPSGHFQLELPETRVNYLGANDLRNESIPGYI